MSIPVCAESPKFVGVASKLLRSASCVGGQCSLIPSQDPIIGGYSVLYGHGDLGMEWWPGAKSYADILMDPRILRSQEQTRDKAEVWCPLTPQLTPRYVIPSLRM